jgi:hypothetical protein
MNRISLLPVIFLAACAGSVGSTDGTSSGSLTLSPTDTARVLDFVSYPGTDAATLDRLVGLDARAAGGIAARRNGADGITPSDDDQPFTTLAQLDAVPYVGDVALAKLAAYSLANPAPAPETVEGVAFTAWQAHAVVTGVNAATVADLEALLDDRAAQNLAAHAPYASVAAMGPIAYVGATALGQLRAQASVWWAMEHGTGTLAGTFDGVAFDEKTAEVAIQIANEATSAQLTGHGVAAPQAAALLGNRPYSTLTSVAGVGSVGTATMKALHAYAAGGDWAPAPADCVGSFQDAVAPHLPDLLFMSESDRPLDIVSFPGAGTAPPTAASLVALVHPEAGSTTETRDPNNFYIDFEPSSGTADVNAGAAVEAAIAAQLTDVVYIAIIPPQGGPNQAEVDVYLVGRTACRDLVGLHAISIET